MAVIGGRQQAHVVDREVEPLRAGGRDDVGRVAVPEDGAEVPLP